MAGAEDQKNQGFKVKDQRRFNPDGTLKDEGENPEAAPEAAYEAPSREAPTVSSEEAHELPADFPTLILSLASSAQIGLGVGPHPGTGKIERNLIQAKHAIDLLGVLEEKTKGNLEKEEGQLLTALLADLRMRFLEEKKKG